MICLGKYCTPLLQTRILLSLAVVLLLAVSCTERITLDLDSTYSRLVVEGQITTVATTHQIKLSRTLDFYSTQAPQPVTGAQVTLSDGKSSIVLNENKQQQGTYETPLRFAGTVGTTYKLNIRLNEEIGGYKNYEASCLIRPTEQPDHIKLAYHSGWNGGTWEIRLYARDPQTDDFYMFHVYRNRVLLTDTLSKVFVIDDRFFNGNYANGVGVAFIGGNNPRERLVKGDTVTLMVANITKEYAKFIQAVQSERFHVPLFGGPPANVQGNVSNGAIGFFAAYQPRYASVIYK